MKLIRIGMKHTGSCLPDQILDAEIDENAGVVTMRMQTCIFQPIVDGISG